MADQSINIVIAGKQYPFKATSPENEQLIRMAAESVNSMLVTYGGKYPQTTITDKLAFVAVFEAMRCLIAQRDFANSEKEEKALAVELENYLSKISR